MAFSNLSENEKAVVHECLKCVASGNVILHNWEFPTVFGISVSEFIQVVESWPELDDSRESVFLAINNSMNNLLGYPHVKYESWDDFMPYTQSEVEVVSNKWKRGQAKRGRGGIQ